MNNEWSYEQWNGGKIRKSFYVSFLLCLMTFILKRHQTSKDFFGNVMFFLVEFDISIFSVFRLDNRSR